MTRKIYRKKKRPLWKPQELRKEEVRGIFTIGVLGLLYVIRAAYGEKYSIIILGNTTISLSAAIDAIFLPWIGYILLMCVGLSDDLFRHPRVRFLPEKSKEFAQVMFVVGIFALLALGALFLLLPLLAVIAISIAIVGPRLMYRRLRKALRR